MLRSQMKPNQKCVANIEQEKKDLGVSLTESRRKLKEAREESTKEAEASARL